MKNNDMELPFYLNFNEFEKNYYTHLEQWFEKYHNTNEVEYLKTWADVYKSYIDYNVEKNQLQADLTINIRNCFFNYQDNFGITFNEMQNRSQLGVVFEQKKISMMEYAQYILDKINRFSKKNDNVIEKRDLIKYLNN